VNERWWEEAACRGTVPLNAFYEDNGQYPASVEDACRECSVYLDCLDWALRFEAHGYWAGTTPEMRRKMRRQRGLHYRVPNAQAGFGSAGHGTASRYQRHIREGSTPCVACKAAHSAAQGRNLERSR
jgi:Transcription factor WhiB